MKNINTVIHELTENALSFNHFHINLKMIKFTYTYTNEKSKNTKEGFKYLIDEFPETDANSLKKVFDKWLGAYNSRRKNKILNVSLIKTEYICSKNIFGDGIHRGISKFTNKVTKYSKEESLNVEDISRIKSIIDIFPIKPSKNKMDYYSMTNLTLKITKSVIEYETTRGNKRSRDVCCISLVQDDIRNCFKTSDFILSHYLSIQNKLKPYKSKKLISLSDNRVILEKNYSKI